MATKKKAARNRRRRESVPHNYWRHRARPVRLGDERFRLTLLRDAPGGKTRRDPISDTSTGFSWDDTSSDLTGSAVMAVAPRSVPIHQGNRLRAEWLLGLGDQWSPLWTMKVSSPERQLQGGAWNLSLSTTLGDARRSRDNYRFKKDKGHPRGWTADQIARFVCRKVGMPVGSLARCTHRITNLVSKDADPVDVIVKAYRMERRATGRRFFLHWDGRMNITALRRPPHLLELAGALIDASYKAELKDEFATSLTVHATTKAGKGNAKGHKRRKIHVRVQSAAGIKRYGYVHRSVDAPNAHTDAQARKYGRKVLDKAMRPNRTLTVTVPIMPTLRRGDAFRVEWRAQGLTQVCFVSSASHNVAPGDMTTQITATFDDPYVDAQAERDRAKRKAAARRRRRHAAERDEAPKGPSGRRGKRRRG